MKTLLFCPTYRLAPETVESIMRQTHTDQLDIFFSRWNPEMEDLREIHCWQFERARQLIIDGEYDALFLVESDMVIPPHALQALEACSSPCASGLYVFRENGYPYSARAFRNNMTKPGKPINHFKPELGEAWGRPIRVSGLGFGCCLLRGEALRVPMRVDGKGYSDWPFAVDLLNLGIEMVCHTGVVCGHKQPDGTILWPTMSGQCLEERGTKENWDLRNVIHAPDRFRVNA